MCYASHASVVQGLEHQSDTLGVGGSIPSRSTQGVTMYIETDFTKLPYTEEEFIAAVSESTKEVHRKIESGEVKLVTPDDLP